MQKYLQRNDLLLTQLLAQITKSERGSFSDGNAAAAGGSESAAGPRHRALSAVGDLYDNLAQAKVCGNIGKGRSANSGGDAK
jgi:hypothetical protein